MGNRFYALWIVVLGSAAYAISGWWGVFLIGIGSALGMAARTLEDTKKAPIQNPKQEDLDV